MHPIEFPVSTWTMIVWVACLGVAAYFFVRLLKFLLRKNKRGVLLLCFGVLLLLGAAIHVAMLSRSAHTVTEGNWAQLWLVSFVAGLEMFVGHTVIFDDIIAAVVFHEPGLLLAYLTIFAFVLSFTIVLVFQILPRRLRDRLWLSLHRRKALADRKNHVFIGVTPNAKRLARSILQEWENGEKRDDQGVVLFVDIPNREGVHAELSLGDVFTSLVSRRKELSLDEELGSDRFVLVNGRYPIGSGEKNLAEAVGFRRLADWFHNERTSVYLLGQEAENIPLLDLLLADLAVKAKVFCLADRSNDAQSVFSEIRGRVRPIDSHLLAVNQVKFEKPDWHPIHFVEVARDDAGRPMGYVSSGFHALSVGFRETGQEAFRFLYEFGSFVGEDRRRVPTTFDLFDDDLDSRRGDFLNRYPGLREDPALIWNEGVPGSDRFWLRYAAIVDKLNYVVVSTGDSARNVELAVRLLETAARAGKAMDHFVILVRVTAMDERTRGILDFFNRTYCPGEAPVLRPFGVSEEVWSLSSISGKGMKERASRFYASFQKAIGGNDTWETRAERLTSRTDNLLEGSMELMRRQGQDLSCSAFQPSMLFLAGPDLAEAAAKIPYVYEGRHYPEKGPEARHLEYLAIQEHLRWMSSHLAAGYVCGERNELLRQMPDLMPYDEVKDPKFEHFDWISVKTYLTDDLQKD